VPESASKLALQHVYDFNVMKFEGGQMGAINGIGADGSLLHNNPQVEEVWTGATFGVASHMIAEGMTAEGFATAKGVNNVVWRDRGYFFRTPEAYDIRGLYRASMYMRPAAIWAMEYALEQKRRRSSINHGGIMMATTTLDSDRSLSAHLLPSRRGLRGWRD
jgi:non-lysosomal glucosylceramidase